MKPQFKKITLALKIADEISTKLLEQIKLMLVKPLTMIIIELSSFPKIYTKLLKYIFKIIIYRKKYCKP